MVYFKDISLNVLMDKYFQMFQDVVNTQLCKQKNNNRRFTPSEIFISHREIFHVDMTLLPQKYD